MNCPDTNQGLGPLAPGCGGHRQHGPGARARRRTGAAARRSGPSLRLVVVRRRLRNPALGLYGGIAAAASRPSRLVIAPLRAQRRGMFRALAGLVIGLFVVGLPLSYLRRAFGSADPRHHHRYRDPPGSRRSCRCAPRAEPGDLRRAGGAAQQRARLSRHRPGSTIRSPRGGIRGGPCRGARDGLAIVAVDEAAGRIEATDRMFWFGFVDDIVVRVRPTDAGSRVDVRSASGSASATWARTRHGCRAYLAALEHEIGGAR